MINDLLVHAWTYRSFRNNPVPGTPLDELLWGETDLVFDRAPEGVLNGQLSFRDPSNNDYYCLHLTGSVEYGTPITLRFQGAGVPGTKAEGWVYDYIGYYVPEWSNANVGDFIPKEPKNPGQRPAIVGSVKRAVPHGSDKPAGVVGSFVAVQQDFLEPRMVIPLPDNVRDLLASEEHRLHHVVWHGTRDLWESLRSDQQVRIRALGWAPPRPSLAANPCTERGHVLARQGAPLVTNGAGEDFLYMHRVMINEVNTMIVRAGGAPIKGWPVIPPPSSLFDEDHPGNPDGFAVPPAWTIPRAVWLSRMLAALKSDEFYWSTMFWWDQKFKDQQYLSTLTLGELGALIEWTVHRELHNRWASIPRDPQTGEPVPSERNPGDISAKWNDATNDYLGDFYSSHVNPVFWRLHGWVDDRIDDWFQAHQRVHQGEVTPQKVGTIDWFAKGKWVQNEEPWCGPMDASGQVHGLSTHPIATHCEQHVDDMKEVVSILFPQSSKSYLI